MAGYKEVTAAVQHELLLQYAHLITFYEEDLSLFCLTSTRAPLSKSQGCKPAQ
jgi:hypothetical protein